MPTPETLSAEKSVSNAGGNTDGALLAVAQRYGGVSDVTGVPAGAVTVPALLVQSAPLNEAEQRKLIEQLNRSIAVYRQERSDKQTHEHQVSAAQLREQEACGEISCGSQTVQDEDPEIRSLVEEIKQNYPDNTGEIDRFLAEHARKPIFPETLAMIKRELRGKLDALQTQAPTPVNNADDLLSGLDDPEPAPVSSRAVPEVNPSEKGGRAPQRATEGEEQQQRIVDWCAKNLPNLSAEETSSAHRACLLLEKQRGIHLTQVDARQYREDILRYINNEQAKTKKQDLGTGINAAQADTVADITEQERIRGEQERIRGEQERIRGEQERIRGEQEQQLLTEEQRNQALQKKYLKKFEGGSSPEEALKELENDPDATEKEKAKLKEIQAILGRLRGTAKTPQDQQIMGSIISGFTPNLRALSAHAAVAPLIAPIQSSGMSAESKKAALSVLGVNYHDTKTGGDMQQNIAEGRGAKQNYKMEEEPPGSGNWKEVPDGEPETIPYDREHPLQLEGGQIAYDNPEDPKHFIFEIPVYGSSETYKMNIPKTLAMKGDYTTQAGIYGGLVGVLSGGGIDPSLIFNKQDVFSKTHRGFIDFPTVEESQRAVRICKKLIGFSVGERLLSGEQQHDLTARTTWMMPDKGDFFPANGGDGGAGKHDKAGSLKAWQLIGLVDEEGRFNESQFNKAAEYIHSQATTPSSGGAEMEDKFNAVGRHLYGAEEWNNRRRKAGLRNAEVPGDDDAGLFEDLRKL